MNAVGLKQPRRRQERSQRLLTRRSSRAYLAVADRISMSQEQGSRVPCVDDPDLFTRRLGEQDRALALRRRAMCAGCPVLDQCAAYRDSGIPVSGYVAGKWMGM